MARYEIKVQVTGADQSASDIKKTTDALKGSEEAARKSTEQTGKLDTWVRRAAQGFNKLGQEIPIAGLALNAVKNPFTAVAAAVSFGIVKFQEYSKALGEIVSNTDHAGKRVDISAEKFSNAAEAVRAMADAMRDLRDFTKEAADNLDDQIGKIEDNIEAQAKLLEAENEVAKARLDRDEADPVKRATLKAGLDNTLAARLLGLRGSKKGQQAALVDQMLQRERDLQVEAGAAVPTREALVASVGAFDASRQNLETAKGANRQAFGKAELLRRFLREGNSPDFFKTFAPSDIRELQSMGLISGISEIFGTGVFKGDLRTDDAAARRLLPGAESALAGTKEAAARAQSAFNMSRAALPAGIARMEDIDPFLAKAEAEAAGVQNESYRREQTLTARRSSLLNGQQFDVQMGRLDVQSTALKGDTAVAEAVRAAAREMGLEVIRGFKQTTEELRRVNAQVRSQAQQ